MWHFKYTKEGTSTVQVSMRSRLLGGDKPGLWGSSSLRFWEFAEEEEWFLWWLSRCLCTIKVQLLETSIQASEIEKELYQSGTSTVGILSVSQKACRSSGVRSCAVWPLHEVERQNGNFHLYEILLVWSCSNSGQSSLWCWRVILNRSWNNFTSAPKSMRLRSRAFPEDSLF